jgi:outer membrane receptor protein involved in Fe transport
MNKALLAVSISLIFSHLSLAQETGQSVESENDSPPTEVEVILVTASSVARTEADTPAKTTLINQESIANDGFSSQADILRTVPGIKVEGGGGEVATNLFIRGLPSAGQFQFTPLNYDGLPAFQSGLTSSAQDVYFRPDLGIQRVEFVGGGASNLFGQGSVAGVINYISKIGDSDPESSIQVEVAEEGRIRTDFYTSGPLSSDDDLYYAFSGYYRRDEGPLDSGLTTRGHQLRGNIHKEFDDGSITIFGQSIDDQVQFFLPIPLSGEGRDRLVGNDGNTVYNAQPAAAANLRYDTADGVFETQIRDGVSVVGESLGLEFKKILSPTWSFNAKAKAADYDHQFNLFLDGDGIINSPETQGSFVSDPSRFVNGQSLTAQFGTPNFTFTESGNALPDDYLLFSNRILDRRRDGDFFSTEFNLTGTFDDIAGFDHSVNFGIFYIDAEQIDFNIITTYLADFRNGSDAQLVDLSFTDEQGNVTLFSDNGIVGPGVSYTNRALSNQRTAFFVTDQLENDKWAFDVGFRVERSEGNVNNEIAETVTINNDPSLAPNLQVNRTGSGRFISGDVSTTEVAISGAAIYKLNEQTNLYANASSGYFFPQLRGVRFDDNGDPQSYDGEDVTLGAVGVKYFPAGLYIDASLFIAELDNRRNIDFVNDGFGGTIEEVSLQSTSTIGAEVIGRWRMTDTLSLEGNITLQDAEFSEGDLDGREPRRQPSTSGNVALRYDDAYFDAKLSVSYTGDTYANDSNTVELDSYSIANLNLGYTFGLAGDQRVRLGLEVFNLFDDDSVTEGSPRQGNSQIAGGSFFVGRPILPRRISLTARYDF